MSVKVTQLESGLRVISENIPTVESVTLGVWVDVGSRYEPKELNGISHFLEHMAFKGTTSRTAQQIAEEIEMVGGDLNAYTSMETTAYHAKVLKEHAPVALDIISDILQNSTFDAEEFKKEQSVILQEIGQYKDTPDDVVFENFQRTSFADQAIGRPILGTEDIISSLTPKQIQDYMHSHYGAKQMIVSAAGNIDHDELIDQVQKKFTKLPKDKSQSKAQAIFTPGHCYEEKELEQLHMVMGFEGVPFGHEDYYSSSVFTTILGGGMSSKLFQEIREKRGLVYTIYSFSSSYRDNGIMGIYAGTSPKSIQELLPAVCEELMKFPKTLEDKEIKKAKAQLKSSLLMSLESTSSRCRQLANQMLVYGRPLEIDEIIAKVDRVTKESLVEVAMKMAHKKPSLSLLGTLKEAPTYEQLQSFLMQ